MSRRHTLILVSSQPLAPDEHRSLLHAYARNRKFFKSDLADLKVIVCHNRTEWRRETRYYHYPFARGLVLRDGTVVVKSRTLARKSLAQWGKIVAHEINHSFFIQHRPRGRDLWSPIWFLEGLACHVAGNDVVMPLRQLAQQRLSILKACGSAKSGAVSPLALLPYRYSNALFPNARQVRLRYSLWCHFVAYLAERKKRGIPQLLALFHTIKTKAQFERAVAQVWNCKLEQMLREFLAQIHAKGKNSCG